MPVDDREESGGGFRRSPTGPWVNAPRAASTPPRNPQPSATKKPYRRRSVLSTLVFALIVLGVGVRAYRDVSRPEAWAYWKDQYFSPSLSSSLLAKVNFGGREHRALAIRGRIGPAAASWFRERLDEARLAPGDVVLLASPGGDLDQAIIMGEIIRSRDLATAVGVAEAAGRLRSAYCASACVLVYAGGKPRYGIEGSLLGVHRFVTTAPASDPIADAQRTTGMLLGYMTRMGVASSVVEAMSETSDVRWLAPKEALTMNLVTDPVDPH
jgi:hypothetical protein